MAPLKANAFEFMRPEYAKLGLAAAPIKTQKSTVVVRIVWVYPKYRNHRPIHYYLPFGSVSVARLKFPDERISDAVFRVTNGSDIPRQLIGYMNREHFGNAINLFSEIGRSEVIVALRAPFNGGHPRTLTHKAKILRIAELKGLWSFPRKIVSILRSEGLLSTRAQIGPQAEAVLSIIAKIKGENL